MVNGTPGKPGGPPAEEWEHHRQTIVRKYLEEGNTLGWVRQWMEDEHQFKATYARSPSFL